MANVTEAQREQLEARGYFVWRQLLPAPRVSAINQRLAELWLEEQERAGAELVMEPRARRLAHLVRKGEIFGSIVTDPLVIETARLVLGRKIRLSSLNARSVPPHSDPRMPLHEDGIAFAGYAGKPYQLGFNAFTVIWMLDEFTAENGATRLVPGTHLSDQEPYRALADPCGPHPDQVVIEGQPGDVLFLNGHCWHGGGENRTGRQRRALLGLYTRICDPLQTDHQRCLPAIRQAGMTDSEREVLGLDDGLVVKLFRRSILLRRAKWALERTLRVPVSGREGDRSTRARSAEAQPVRARRRRAVPGGGARRR